MVTSEPGTISAATRANAAELGSAGTAIARPRSSGSPVTVMRVLPPRSADPHLGAEVAQHALGVVARRLRLDHGRLAGAC